MKFSLVLSTIGRIEELVKFLNSLTNQTYQDFELILIDQNNDDRLVKTVEYYSDKFSIINLKSERGLSRGRNSGLRKISGDIIAFPDDDCEYPDDLLKNVADFFENSPEWDGLTGCSIDRQGNDSAGKFSKEEAQLNLLNLWNRNISFTIFLRNFVFQKIGNFDENLGLGADTIFLSGEETDYLIRAIKAEYKVFYSRKIKIYHPNPTSIYDSKSLARAYHYGCGWGRVLKKHRYPLWFKLASLIRPLGGSLISLGVLNVKKSNYHLNVFRGRLRGMMNP